MSGQSGSDELLDRFQAAAFLGLATNVLSYLHRVERGPKFTKVRNQRLYAKCDLIPWMSISTESGPPIGIQKGPLFR